MMSPTASIHVIAAGPGRGGAAGSALYHARRSGSSLWMLTARSAYKG